jgi:6-phosphogluconate dehydrogenase
LENISAAYRKKPDLLNLLFDGYFSGAVSGCEAYSLLKNVLGMGHGDMADLFAEWNKTELDSYLIEITADILRYKDFDGGPLVEKILDCAGQKGTGKWTSSVSLELDTPVTLVTEAVYARMVSAMVDERRIAAYVYEGASDNKSISIGAEDIRKALLASKIVSYAQGFMMLSRASSAYLWDLDLGRIALMWRGGCIIRSVFLENISAAYRKKPDLLNLLFDGYFSGAVSGCEASWRRVVAAAAMSGVAVPAFSSALGFYDAYRCEQSAANLLQAQRDYFGAHTYERVDRPRGEFFHTDWAGTGGNAVSGAYLA